MPGKLRPLCFALVFAGFLTVPLARLLAQTLSNIDREDDRAMLRDAVDAIKKHYYDPKFHGLDLDKLYAQYDEKMRAAESNHQALGVVAAFLENLDDSHTRFLPPEHVNHVDYGYLMQMIGDNCFVTEVRPSTDALSKLHPGDQILKRENHVVNRKDIDTMQYYFQAIDPLAQSILDIQSPSGQLSHVEVNAKVKEGKKLSDLNQDNDFWELIRRMDSEDHVLHDRLAETGDITIWKMPFFGDDNEIIDQHFATARKHQGLILDLRGNPGGAIEVLQEMLGHVFDHEVTIANRVTRKETKPLTAKPQGTVYSGKLIVLIDSQSASAAELFARVIQLENRGIVLGDHSSGMVMEAKIWPYEQGGGYTAKFYEFEVTEADLIMKDGKSLEKTGVAPVQVWLPTAADLAAGRDPVLSKAASLLGATLDPTEAGKLFPYEWVPL
jgi:C-terminal processing protease CtpA/Prc